MAKFVRWLGAFGVDRFQADLIESARWEVAQQDRQVSAEPLWRGKSLIRHPQIGLVVDEANSQFCRGWLQDAWTCRGQKDNGVVSPTFRAPEHRTIRSMDAFLRAWNTQSRPWIWDEKKDRKSRTTVSAPMKHGEVTFDLPAYRAVAVKANARKEIKERAAELAALLGLPVELVAFDNN